MRFCFPQGQAADEQGEGTVWLDPLLSIDTILGTVGVMLYVGAYAALQTGYIKGQSYTYASLNLAAASAVLFSLMTDFNLSAVVLNLFFVCFSILGIIRLFLIGWESSGARFTPEDLAFLHTKLPDLPRHLGRRLLDRATWIDAQPGLTLTEEDRPVEAVYCLTDGAVCVRMDGETVGRLEATVFIGDIGWATGRPATATVRTATPARLLRFPAQDLRAMVRRYPALGLALESGFASDCRRKLVMARAHARAHMDGRTALAVLHAPAAAAEPRADGSEGIAQPGPSGRDSWPGTGPADPAWTHAPER
jgi:CRP-like cAMP-binding protein